MQSSTNTKKVVDLASKLCCQLCSAKHHRSHTKRAYKAFQQLDSFNVLAHLCFEVIALLLHILGNYLLFCQELDQKIDSACVVIAQQKEWKQKRQQYKQTSPQVTFRFIVIIYEDVHVSSATLTLELTHSSAHRSPPLEFWGTFVQQHLFLTHKHRPGCANTHFRQCVSACIWATDPLSPTLL